jgi:long-chain acyl-CoA synthetase
MLHHNLPALFHHQAERYGPRIAVRYKRQGAYHDLSWQRYLADVRACAAALAAGGIRPGDRVGLWAENRPEWVVADMGIMTAAAINVPAHCTLSAKQVHDQFAHAEISWLFLATRQQYEKLKQVPDALAGLRGIVIFEEGPHENAITWAACLTRGRHALGKVASELRERVERLSSDDLATIMYTSGTTGNAKGVMLSHRNLVSNALSMVTGTGIDEESVILSWLPYSHIYGRLVDDYVSIAAGATLCLAESQETLIDNLREIRPTSFSAVPRFYEKVLAAVSTDEGEERHRRLRDIFGPRLKWLNSGGAPLPLHIAQALTDAGLLVLQGYGLTESSPVITFNRQESNRLGTVGLPVPDVEVRIAPDGEVLTRGPHVMKGYWKNPAATAETIRDGWLCTGDLGSLDADGYLSITGRKKDLLVLSNGKKVVPTEIEGMLVGDDCIDQAVVYGEGKNFLTALIVPHFANLRAAAGIDEQENERLVRDPALNALLSRRIEAILTNLAPWEQVRKFLLMPRPFTQEAEELTVSLKLRRGVIIQKYRRQLEALYAE